MKAFRVLAVACATAILVALGTATASADVARPAPVAVVPTAATGSSSGIPALLLAPFILGCWMLTHTGSDTPSPQCDAIFQPMIQGFVSG